MDVPSDEQDLALRTIFRPLNHDELRVLRIDQNEAMLTCTLDVKTKSAVGIYFAVSWCWGTQERSMTISCNGVLVKVTRNLYDMLQTTVKWFPEDSLWIDAICINQADDIEKATQVSRMAKIFRGAARVIVWLGNHEESHEVVIDASQFSPPMRDILYWTKWIKEPYDDLILNCSRSPNTIRRGLHWLGYLDHNSYEPVLKSSTIPSLIENLSTIPSEFAIGNLQDRDLPGYFDDVWPAIADLFSRPWFSRLWVVQEIAMAKEIVVLYDDQKTDWHSLIALAEQLIRTSMFGHCLRRANKTTQTLESTGFRDLNQLENLRRRYNSGHLLIHHLLHLAQERMVTKPVDRIFALHGLMTRGTRRAISIDYRIDNGSFWLPCLQMARHVVQKDPKLYMLSLATTGEWHPQIPSWCPNLNSRRSKDSFTMWGGKGYRAGLKPKETRVCKVSLLDNLKSISIPGFRVDTIAQIVQCSDEGINHLTLIDRYGPRGYGAQVLKWESECLSLSRRVLGFPAEEVEEAHWRTLIVDLGANNNSLATPAPTEFEKAYHTYKDWCSTLVKGSRINFRDVDMKTYMQLLATLQGWSFFSTHGGRIGRGSPKVQVGDEICVLYSGEPLYALRFDEIHNIAKLTGEVYVHGLMTFEDIINHVDIQNETFIIQ